MTMITPSYLGETIEYSSLHACRSTLEDPTWILLSHLLVVVTSTFAALILWTKDRLELRALHTIELVLLGVGALFFSLYEVSEFRDWELHQPAGEGYRSIVLDLTGDSCALRWFVLTVFYGFFMPNTRRRCAIVVSVLALCPLAVAVGVGIVDGRLGQIRSILGDMGIWMGLALLIALYGSHEIRRMGQQANDARELGRYRLTQLLGSGGMGEVYLAQHALLRRPSAIKLIRPERAGDRLTQRQFDDEVQAVAALTDPNTIQIFDYGVAEDGTFYYTMEYLPGLTLQEIVEHHGPLPPERAVYFLRQVCSALQEAHERGLIHRDIKPRNVMACQLGVRSDFVKLLDFGLVQSVSWNHPNQPTAGGRVAGTPAYMSPEQASGRKNLDARSDLYSLGAVGYFLLTGHPPFGDKSLLHFLVAVQEQPMPSLDRHRRAVPPDLEAVIMQCLDKDPDRRFSDAAKLEQGLNACECASGWDNAKAARWWQDHPAPDRSIVKP